MNTYKVIFARNEPLSCEITNKVILNGDYDYKHDKGQLIYALIKADSEEDALNKSDKIIKEVTEKVFGSDFVV